MSMLGTDNQECDENNVLLFKHTRSKIRECEQAKLLQKHDDVSNFVKQKTAIMFIIVTFLHFSMTYRQKQKCCSVFCVYINMCVCVCVCVCVHVFTKSSKKKKKEIRCGYYMDEN